MRQSSFFDGLFLDAPPSFDDGLVPSEVDIGGREVAKALVVAPVIVVLYEGVDLRFQVSRQVVVFEQNAVLQGLVPALDLALRLGMIGRAADMDDIPVIEPFGQVAGYVGGAVVTEQARPMGDLGAITSRCRQSPCQCVSDIAGLHGRA